MFVLCLLLCGIAGEQGGDQANQEVEVVTTNYSDAYKRHKENGTPLVVIVTAEWCQPCQETKRFLRPKYFGRKDICYAEVDFDNETELARKLMHGASIPQIMIYYNENDKVRCQRYVGGGNGPGVEGFLKRLFGRR